MNRVTQTASHWGVYNVTTNENGDVVDTTPLAMDPHPARYVGSLPALVRSPLRIDQPYVRAGYLAKDASKKRGGDSFVPVSWDRALGLVADELRRVKAEFGNQAIYGGADGWASAGRLHHAPTLMRRFLGLHGGFVDKRGNHSFGAALTVMPYVIGRGDIPNLVVPWESIVGTTEVMVMFGGAAVKNMQTSYGGAVRHENPDWFARAAAAGIEFVNISPSRQNLDDRVRTDWIPIRPNTDVALMLALAHTLVVNGLHDRAFLDKYCVGYEVFERYLLGSDGGEPRDAAWAASLTGVPADTILALAKRMAGRRTLVTTSWSIQRADHGEQPVWMTVVLAAMLGQIGKTGCGFSLGFGAENGAAKTKRSDVPRPAMAVGPNAVSAFIPVGLAAEMILNPGRIFDYNGQKITAPDIRLIYSAGGNPFHHNTNLNRFLEAWQRPETIIVHEAFWNPAARHADIVLPATTTMERNDIQAGDAERSWVAMHKVVEPVGQARNDFDILADLATRLGFGPAFTEDRDEIGWLRHLYESVAGRAHSMGVNTPDFDTFWATGMFEFPGTAPRTLFGEFIADPVKNPLRTASGKIEIFSAKIAGYGYDDCPPHPSWMEPAEWLGSPLARRFPLHLLSNQPTTRLHSQLDPAPVSRNSKVNGREPVMMHASDAAARGLVAGDVVRVFNDRGAFLAGLVIADYLTPGVVQIATGAWYDPAEGGVPGTLEKHGNPNVVTINKSASRLSHAPAAQTVLVEIEKAPARAPQVTVFERPPMQAPGGR